MNIPRPNAKSFPRRAWHPLTPAAIAAGFFLLAVLPARPADPRIGWIPIQFVAPGQSLTLDMRRFFEPGSAGQLELPAPSGSHYEAAYDKNTYTLSVKLSPKASGFVEIPLLLTDPGKPRPLEATLTIAASAPGSHPVSPAIFAESQNANELTFRIVPGGPGTTVSAIAEFADGTSKPVAYHCGAERLLVSTAMLPQGTWVRVSIASPDGKISRPARALVGTSSEFHWQDGILYYAFTDRFADGDPSNDHPVQDPKVAPQANYQGGDFQGIRKKIDAGYFRDLGVNVLWLAPLNQNPEGAWAEYLPPYRSYSGYHGYWPVSSTEVESRFGGAEALAELVSTAKQNRIKIIADLVLRHTHIEHPLWKEKREWFGNLMLPDGRKNLRIWDEQQFTTWFEEWLPGFDFDNPEAVSFLLGNAEYWVKTFGLDGYRLDAVKHIKPAFWWKFRTAMRGLEKSLHSEPMYFVGETFMEREGIMQFVGPNMLDGQFDFPLYDTIIDVFATGKKGLGDLENSLSASETIYGKETLMSPLIGNHDKSRFLAFADGDLPDPKIEDEEEVGWTKPPQVDHPESYEKLKLALAFILAIDGVPMVYYGDEVGLTGAGDPDNRRMLPADSDLSPEQLGVREFFSKAAKFRQSHPALRYGNRRLLVAEKNRYAFARRHFSDAVLCAWNNSGEAQNFALDVAPELPDGTYADALGGESISVEGGKARFVLPPRKTAYFSIETAAPEGAN